MKLIFKIACGLILLSGGYFAHVQTDGFQVNHVLSTLQTSAEADQPLPECLNQPFYYFKSGGEVYNFLSEDEKWVLKLFKHHHLRVDSYLNRFKLPGKMDGLRLLLLGHGNISPHVRLKKLFDSCTIASTLLEEETEVVYAQLNKTKNFNQQITIIDKLGISHSLPSNQLEFIVQRKADLLYPKLEEILNEEDLEGAKRRISSLMGIFKTFHVKGILDHDSRLYRNFGFVGEKAVRLDMGGLEILDTKLGPDCYRELMIKQFAPLHQWLNARSPELATYLEEELTIIFNF